MTTDVEQLLRNVLADALAHHEAREDIASVVHVESGEPYMAWLDYELAGRVAARALEVVPTPAGWTGPTPIYAVRADRPESLPSVDAARSESPRLDPPEANPATDPGEDLLVRVGARAIVTPNLREQLLDRVLQLAREVMPDGDAHLTWLVDTMVALGRERNGITPAQLGELTPKELLVVLERLAKWRAARDRNARRRGLAGLSPGRSL